MELTPQQVDALQNLLQQNMQQNIVLDDKSKRVSPNDLQQVAVATNILAKYDIIRVASGDLYYYRSNDANSYTYSKMNDRTMKNIIRPGGISLPCSLKNTKIRFVTGI